MQLSFDPRDPNACSAVVATIFCLHGEIPSIPDFGAPAPSAEPALDPAQAFDAPSAESAFSPAPVAAPIPAVTAAPAPAASPSSVGVELDADGLPWDGRIHSGPADKKPKNADGRWRAKRGVDDATIAQVQAELRQIMAAPAPVAAPLEPAPAPVAAAPIPAPPAPVPMPAVAATASGPDVATIAPSPVPLEPAPAAVTAPPSPAPLPAASSNEPVESFADLMKKITRMQTARALTVEDTSQIAQSLGLTGVRDLIQRPDLVTAFDALLPPEAA